MLIRKYMPILTLLISFAAQSSEIVQIGGNTTYRDDGRTLFSMKSSGEGICKALGYEGYLKSSMSAGELYEDNDGEGGFFWNKAKAIKVDKHGEPVKYVVSKFVGAISCLK